MIEQIIKILLLSCIFIKGYAQDDWEVDPSDYQYSMTITGVVSFNDSIYDQTEGVVVAAFVDDSVCVGKATSRYYSKVDKYRVPLMVYGNEIGLSVTLKAIVPGVDSVFSFMFNYQFEADAILGNYAVPVVWNASTVTRISQQEPFAFQVFPNPATCQLTLSGLGNTSDCKVKLIDVSGRYYHVETQNKGDKVTLDVADFPRGLYVVSLSTEAAVFTQKLLLE